MIKIMQAFKAIGHFFQKTIQKSFSRRPSTGAELNIKNVKLSNETLQSSASVRGFESAGQEAGAVRPGAEGGGTSMMQRLSQWSCDIGIKKLEVKCNVQLFEDNENQLASESQNQEQASQPSRNSQNILKEKIKDQKQQLKSVIMKDTQTVLDAYNCVVKKDELELYEHELTEYKNVTQNLLAASIFCLNNGRDEDSIKNAARLYVETQIKENKNPLSIKEQSLKFSTELTNTTSSLVMQTELMSRCEKAMKQTMTEFKYITQENNGFICKVARQSLLEIKSEVPSMNAINSNSVLVDMFNNSIKLCLHTEILSHVAYENTIKYEESSELTKLLTKIYLKEKQETGQECEQGISEVELGIFNRAAAFSCYSVLTSYFDDKTSAVVLDIDIVKGDLTQYLLKNENFLKSKMHGFLS